MSFSQKVFCNCFINVANPIDNQTDDDAYAPFNDYLRSDFVEKSKELAGILNYLNTEHEARLDQAYEIAVFFFSFSIFIIFYF